MTGPPVPRASGEQPGSRIATGNHPRDRAEPAGAAPNRPPPRDDPPAWWWDRPEARSWRCAPPRRDALAFHAGLPGYAPTPLAELPALAERLGVGRVFVKDESARLGLGAFKAVGASWAVASVLAGRERLAHPWTVRALRSAAARSPAELVTATDGNHGRAVAWMARLLGIGARVFVPNVTRPAVIAVIAAEGADVAVADGDYDQAVRESAGYAGAAPGRLLVQDTAWTGYTEIPALIVEGYETILAEAGEQLLAAGSAGPGLVSVPAGVGSLAQAVVAHYRSRDQAAPPPGVLTVEPDTAACVLASLLAGGLTTVPTAATVMAGLNCGTPSLLGWPVLRDGLDAAVAVTDAAATAAVAELAGLGISSGPSGAASLAGARAALTGSGSAGRRERLGVHAGSGVLLLNTEGSQAAAR